MKVFAVNGSPKKEGNTAYALQKTGEKIQEQGIDFEVSNIGTDKIRGCISCFHCVQNKTGKCVFDDDMVNNSIEKMRAADAIILASPTYYAGINGSMKSFLDRVFFSNETDGKKSFRHKVGAALVAVRRSGAMQALNTLNSYLLYSEMFIASSNYWNIIHGMFPQEASQDTEGNQIMQVLGENIAYLLKIKEAAKNIVAPEPVRKTLTNFIR